MVKVKKTPQRRCLGCDTNKDKKELLRVVRSPQGDISLDKTGKKPGRGAYVCCSRECVLAAISGKRLEKALGVTINEELKNKLLEEL
ncbi:MAG: YlxR family protein [Acidaminococcaceae bacterium]|nr:YlxR family protein [Acidaminococcaceae bacterium]